MPEVTQDQLAEVEMRLDDLAAEIQYQTSRIGRLVDRVEDALRDIQGVNLEQRIAVVLRDGPQSPPTLAPPVPEQSPFRAYWSNIGSGIAPASVPGEYPLVQSVYDRSADSGTEEVALQTPDDGTVESETPLPDRSQDEST